MEKKSNRNFHWNKYYTIGAVVIVLLLAAAFFWTGSGFSFGVQPEPTNEPAVASQTDRQDPVASPQNGLEAEAQPTSTPQASSVPAATPEMKIDPKTGKDQYQTEPVPSNQPVPVEPGEAEITENKMTVTLSIRCDTLLTKLDFVDPNKRELVPADGILLAPTAVTFYEGESVFNVLQRETKRNKIHMEFVNTPLYNSAYIEGIGNLYELDCGELSGWMYRVNGWFPNYGCSRYQLKDGDVIEWVYTTDLGCDVGSSLGGLQR